MRYTRLLFLGYRENVVEERGRMILVIDAYNMIKKRGIDDGARGLERFIGMLSVYAQDKRHEIYLVFDGYRDDISFAKTLVRVIFAGRYNKSADEEIISLIKSLGHKEICLISDDRELSRAVSAEGACIIKNDIMWEAFAVWHRQKQAKKKLTIIQKGSMIQKSPWSEASSEIDELMNKGSQQVVIKDLIAEKKTFEPFHEKVKSAHKKKYADEKILKKL